MNEELQNEYVDVNVHDDYPSSDEHITVPPMKVLPLKKICMTIGQLPTAYLETMTYYEMLLWFIGYLRDNIIPTVNNNGEALEEVQTIVMSLQNYINNFKDSIDQSVEDLEDYVNNYFENLDVQEEINNKLDDMLEQGTLQEIIDQFIQNTCLWCFDNVNAMKQATNLIVGSYARTLGYHTVNDGGASMYYITDVEDLTRHQETLTSGLYANLVYTDIMTPEQFGAYGNASQLDQTYITKAIEQSVLYNFFIVGSKHYLINSTITIDSNVNLKLNKLSYTGLDRAILITGKFNHIEINEVSSNAYGVRLSPTLTQTCANNVIKIDRITSHKNGLELIAEDWGILDNEITFNYIRTVNSDADSYAIYCYAEHNVNSTHPAYVGEITFNCGRVSGGLYGVYVKSMGDSPAVNCEITGLKFYSLSVEGNTAGIYLDNANFCVFDYPRYQELATGDDPSTIIKLTNNTRSCIFNLTTPIAIPNIDITGLTCSPFTSNEINGPLRINYKGSINGRNTRLNQNGLFYEPLYKFVQQTIGASVSTVDLTSREVLATYIVSNSTVDLTITLNKNYNPYGMSEFYFRKTDGTGKVDFYANDGTTRLYTIQAGSNGAGFYHFGFNQDGYFVVIQH